MLIDIEHEDAITRTYILFEQTAHEVQKYSNAYFYRKARISAIKFIMLKILASNGGTMTPTQISQWVSRERHDITTLVARMSKEGLIRTRRNTEDRRSINIILTDKGREVLDQVAPVAKDIINQVMLSISKADATSLERSLGTLRQNAHYGIEEIARRSQPNNE